MSKSRSSIAKIVKDMVYTHPAIKECLTLDVINHSALAALVLEELKGKGITASTGAVKMALIRTGEELKLKKASLERKINPVVAGTVIELQTDLRVITAEKAAVLSSIRHISKFAETARFFQLTQGVGTFTIVISREEAELIVQTLTPHIVESIPNQTAIVLISPHEIIETPGVVSYITGALSSMGINITQVISCHKDTIYVLDREEAPAAYRLLEEIILSMR
ncbi:MAG: ACT domain-containing protein [Theionarchaea archaeon]|nr:ACT domain-containing protein [Theionarchaea archaeon]